MRSARKQAPTSARKPARVVKQHSNNMSTKDPVQVYCRLRPMQYASDVSCMKVVSDTTIIITPPESAMNFRNAQKEIQTTFTRVFTENVSQREVFQAVSLPLVENLIHGRNGLLFTYGVTGSGKTYTMTGESNDSGIMPRCLDVIFNSITNYQAKKFVFKPDKLNGFDVQNETDAMIDRQNELHSVIMTPRNPKTPRRKIDSDNDSDKIIAREHDESGVFNVDPDYVYAIFVTYVEIYNNSVYDLLEEDEIRAKTLQSKIVREDGNKNMYVHAVTEVEVKSSDEAFEVFQRGQRRRRVAHTALNAESSRSHSVFTIRLVQAPLDNDGEQVLQDKRVVCVGQLSLVDLAGSERTNRTKNTGQRLREAGNINNSLMTLRTCLEILRENQNQGTSKIVPYRDSKLTHLFKNYFDGEGQVRMVVCANPRADDYDETIQVMKFAEMTQEVQVARPTVTKLDLGFTPGRRQANKIFKEARSRLEREIPEAANLDVDIGLVYSLGAQFPDFDISSPHNDQVIMTLINFLEQRINKKNVLRADLEQKHNDFRKLLMAIEQENMNLKVENASIKASSTQQKKKVSALEGHLCKTEAQIDSLLRKLNNANDTIKSLQQELRDREMVLNKRMIDEQMVKQKYTTRMNQKSEKLNREFELKLKAQRDRIQNQIKEKDEKLRLVKQILDSDDPGTIPVIKDSTDEETQPQSQPSGTKTPGRMDCRSRKDKVGVANLRYRRSQSADRWVDHGPGALVPVGTVLQPLMRRRRSINKLTSPKEITDGASKYCLTAQNHDSEGELETKLYKADILPTSGGGAQVVFNDIECLKQLSPTGQRKRSAPDTETDNHHHVGADYVNHCASQGVTITTSKRPRK